MAEPLAAARPEQAARTAIRAAAGRLLDGFADPSKPGLVLRGHEHAPLRLAEIADGDTPAIAARGLLRLAHLASAAAAALADHPDPAVRRSAAVVAARAHPLIAGLGTPR